MDYLSTEICPSKRKRFPLLTFIDTPGLVDGDLLYPFDVNDALVWLGLLPPLLVKVAGNGASGGPAASASRCSVGQALAGVKYAQCAVLPRRAPEIGFVAAQRKAMVEWKSIVA